MQKIKLNSSRKYLERFLIEAAQSLPVAGRVLDAGAGDGRYRSLFPHAKYEAADLGKLDKRYGEISYQCDLSSIPIQDNQYDMVICTQVLEHVPEPKAVLAELHRVLKLRGELWLSAPLFFPEHEIPYDYYRYTQFGASYLLESVGFKIKRIKWLEGYYGTLAYQLKVAAFSLPFAPRYYGRSLLSVIAILVAIILKPVFLGLSIFFSLLDMRYKNVSSGHCKNYAIIAVKMPPPS